MSSRSSSPSSDSQKFSGLQHEEQLAAQYFHQKPDPKKLVYSEKHSRKFGTVYSVAGTQAVVQALPTFDFVSAAVVRCGDAYGEVFDAIGPQFEPLYVVRFSEAVEVGKTVEIDISTIQKAEFGV